MYSRLSLEAIRVGVSVEDQAKAVNGMLLLKVNTLNIWCFIKSGSISTPQVWTMAEVRDVPRSPCRTCEYHFHSKASLAFALAGSDSHARYGFCP